MEAIAWTTAALARAIELGDASEVAGLYDPDATLLTAAAELIAGPVDIASYWRAGIALGVSRLDLDAVELHVADGVATEVGRYALAFGDGAAPVDRGKYVVLHRRQPDGSWRRGVEVFNPDAPAEVRLRRS